MPTPTHQITLPSFFIYAQSPYRDWWNWTVHHPGETYSYSTVTEDQWVLVNQNINTTTIIASSKTGGGGVTVNPASRSGMVNDYFTAPPFTLTFPEPISEFIPVVGTGAFNDPKRYGQFEFLFSINYNPYASTPTFFRCESICPTTVGRSLQTTSLSDDHIYYYDLTYALNEIDYRGYGVTAYNGAKIESITFDWGDGTEPTVLPPGPDLPLPYQGYYSNISHNTRGVTATHRYYRPATNPFTVTIRDTYGRKSVWLAAGHTSPLERTVRIMSSAKVTDGIAYVSKGTVPFTHNVRIWEGDAMTDVGQVSTVHENYLIPKSLWGDRHGNLFFQGGMNAFSSATYLLGSSNRGRSWGITGAFLNTGGAFFPGGFAMEQATFNGLQSGRIVGIVIQNKDWPYGKEYAVWSITSRQIGNTHTPPYNTPVSTPVKVGDVTETDLRKLIFHIWEQPDGRVFSSNFYSLWMTSVNAGKTWTMTRLDEAIWNEDDFYYTHGSSVVGGGVVTVGVYSVDTETEEPGEAPIFSDSLWFRSALSTEDPSNIVWSDPIKVADLEVPHPYHVHQTLDGRLVISNGHDKTFVSEDFGKNWDEVTAE